MPRHTERPALLAAAAVTVLASAGSRGLTHRRVDAEAGVPSGTTTNYFPSRPALFEAAARWLLDEQLANLDRIVREHHPADRAALIRATVALIDPVDGAVRTRYLAHQELALEAARSPELAALVRRLRGVNVRQATELIRASGADVAQERVDWLGSLLTGVAMDRIIFGTPEGDLTELVGRVYEAVIG